MKHALIALALLALPLPVLADPPAAVPPSAAPPAAALPPSDLGAPLSAAQFEAYATGKTLTYAQDGTVWGQEQYLPGRGVVWEFTGEPCEYGTWTEEKAYDDTPMMCFVYDDNPDTNCWQFYLGKTGLVALFVGGGNTAFSEVGQTQEPMQCPGPKVGV